MRMAIAQNVYFASFIGASLFFWHDFAVVLIVDKGSFPCHHCWLKVGWFARVGTIAFELLKIYQAYPLWPQGTDAKSAGVLGLLKCASQG